MRQKNSSIVDDIESDIEDDTIANTEVEEVVGGMVAEGDDQECSWFIGSG